MIRWQLSTGLEQLKLASPLIFQLIVRLGCLWFWCSISFELEFSLVVLDSYWFYVFTSMHLFAGLCSDCPDWRLPLLFQSARIHLVNLKWNLSLQGTICSQIKVEGQYCIEFSLCYQSSIELWLLYNRNCLFTADSHSFLTDFRPSCDIETSKTEMMAWLSFSWTCIFSRLPAFDKGLNLFSSHCNNYSCQPSVIQAIAITT